MKGRSCLGLLLACLLVAQASCVGLPPSGAGGPRFRPGFNLFSPEQDIELGEASAEEVLRQVRLYEDARTNAYVRRLGARLAEQAEGFEFPYRFVVVASPEVNAFALPGGYVFVNAGAIAAARNEGELAGVLAHEISHVALRHGTNQASKAYVAKAGLGILDAAAGGAGGELARWLGAVGGAGADLVFLKLGRTAETQADLEGARLMAAAGYDPRDMARFFETLGEREAARPRSEEPNDHPDPVARVRAINELIPSLRTSPSPARDAEEFRQIKKRLRGY